MKLSIGKNLMIMILMITALACLALVFGIYDGYNRGYADGMQNTNTWWIDKQSRYYDSSEVEKKNRARNQNLI